MFKVQSVILKILNTKFETPPNIVYLVHRFLHKLFELKLVVDKKITTYDL